MAFFSPFLHPGSPISRVGGMTYRHGAIFSLDIYVLQRYFSNFDSSQREDG